MATVSQCQIGWDDNYYVGYQEGSGHDLFQQIILTCTRRDFEGKTLETVEPWMRLKPDIT
jgi:hypothetical protein